MFEPRRSKDLLKAGKESEEVKEDKHLVKLGTIRPQKGHRIFKVVSGEIRDVSPTDFIENMAVLKFIKPDKSFGYTVSIKMKEGRYISALNKTTAKKRL